MNLNYFKSLFFSNQQLSQIIFKNTSWMLLANIIAKLFKFGMMIIVARELGPGLFGSFNYVIVLSTMCFVLSDIGLNLLIIREYQNIENKKELISTGFYIKLLLVIINICFAIGCCFFIETQLLPAFVIFTVMNIIDSIKQYNMTIARANLNQELEAISFIIETTLTSLLGIVFVLKFNSLFYLAFAYLIGSTCSFIYINLKTMRKIFPLEKLNTQLFLTIMKQMAPFVLSSFLFIALTSVDTLMIKWLLGASFVGFYHAGLKLIETILIFPGLFGMSIYPFTSRFQKDLSRLRKIITDSTGIMCLIGIPITFGGILLAHPILVGIFSDIYTLGVQPFQVLLLTTFPLFIIFILNNALLSTNNEKVCVQNTAISFSLNIIFNIIFIPKYGITGAAIGTLIGRVTLFFLVIYHTKKLLQINTLFQKNIFKYLLLSVIMCITIYCLQMAISNVFILILIGVISYIFMLVLLKDPYLNKATDVIVKKDIPLS